MKCAPNTAAGERRKRRTTCELTGRTGTYQPTAADSYTHIFFSDAEAAREFIDADAEEAKTILEDRRENKRAQAAARARKSRRKRISQTDGASCDNLCSAGLAGAAVGHDDDVAN